MKTIAFFNDKGGVGKTTLVYHLAWIFADMGKRVLVADLEPQANLTSMFLTEEKLEKLWDPENQELQSIMTSLSPLIKGLGDIGTTPTQKIGLICNLSLATSVYPISKRNSQRTGRNVWIVMNLPSALPAHYSDSLKTQPMISKLTLSSLTLGQTSELSTAPPCSAQTPSSSL